LAGDVAKSKSSVPAGGTRIFCAMYNLGSALHCGQITMNICRQIC
jgi:hypothetical protein